MTNAQIGGEAYNGGYLGPRGVTSWLFVGFVMGFAAVIAACWILFADFVAAGWYFFCASKNSTIFYHIIHLSLIF